MCIGEVIKGCSSAGGWNAFEGGDIFASPTVGPGFTYRPQFVTMQKDRGTLLLILSMIGLAGAAAGAMSLGSLFVWGWFIPFLTLAASVTAWFLGAQDLRAMHLGAMKSEGRTTTLLATWLGGFGTLLVVGFVALMVWLGFSFLPSFLG